MKDARQLQLENDRLRAEKKRLQAQYDDARLDAAEARSRLDHSLGATKLVPGELLEALVALYHVAHYGLPPAGEQVHVSVPFESRAPVSDRRAYRKLHRTLGDLRSLGDRLTLWIDNLDQRLAEGEHHDVAAGGRT